MIVFHHKFGSLIEDSNFQQHNLSQSIYTMIGSIGCVCCAKSKSIVMGVSIFLVSTDFLLYKSLNYLNVILTLLRHLHH